MVFLYPRSRQHYLKIDFQLQALGATTELYDNPKGRQTFPGGEVVDFPPIILGRLGTDPAKKTLLIYGHLDVQPAKKEDGWDTEPFVLTEKDGKLYGRGSTDDKLRVLKQKKFYGQIDIIIVNYGDHKII